MNQWGIEDEQSSSFYGAGGAVAALALTTTGASAAPVSATGDATAKARILKPLVLKSTANFDLGMIVLAGAGPYTATVSLDKTGAFDCDGGSGNVVCSGSHAVPATTSPAPRARRDDRVGPASSRGVALTPDLTLTPDHDTTVALANSGAPGTDFWVGGSLSVSEHGCRRRLYGHLRPDRRLSVSRRLRISGPAPRQVGGVASNGGPFFIGRFASHG